MFDTDTLHIPGVEHRLRLTVSAIPTAVRATAARARASVEDLLATNRAEDFESAVAEAVANAVEHGNGPRPGAVSVKVDVCDGWIVARIRDAGSGHAANGPLDLRADPPGRARDPERGRGMTMMCRLADEVEVVDHAEGRVLQLRMRTDAPDDARG